MDMDDRTHRSARAARRRTRLVRALETAGVLDDPAWSSAFGDVPRHAFLDRFFRADARGRWVAVDRTDQGWLDAVYADRVLVTQLDDDPTRWAEARANGPVTGVPTSSSSQPAIMAVMLAALRGAAGHRVLEIGTGTGYNAALLSHRFGERDVTSVDIDPALVETARGRLAEIGYRPTCVAGDGAEGHPDNAPYDRVLATCAVATIPLPWLAQTAPGGLVVTTLHRPLGAGLVRITAGEGATGTGRVLPEDGRFMPLRAHRIVSGARPEHPTGPGRPTVLGSGLLASPRSAFEFYAGLVLPQVATSGEPDDVVWLGHPDGSWVRHVSRGDAHQVWQGGPRALWDDVEAAYEQWLALGEPTRARFGITVAPDRQEIWLDDPTSPHRWPLRL
jgi:methyltransferase of ATP-grasp peptide maturase system